MLGAIKTRLDVLKARPESHGLLKGEFGIVVIGGTDRRFLVRAFELGCVP